MRRLISSVIVRVVTVAALLVGGPAAALTPAQKCVADKVTAATKYAACRLNAHKKARKKEQPPELTKCNATLTDKWLEAEEKAGGQCPANGDLNTIQVALAQNTDSIIPIVDPRLEATGCGVSFPGCGGFCPLGSTCRTVEVCGNGVGECDVDADCFPFACLEDSCRCVPLTATKRMFATGGLYAGNLGGLAGADAICAATAAGAGLSGVFKAWLSDRTTSASDRLSHSTLPYVNTAAKVIANSWADLVEGDDLQEFVRFDEFGQEVGIPKRAWTCTDRHGSTSCLDQCVPVGTIAGTVPYCADACLDWTTAAPPPESRGAIGMTNPGFFAFSERWTEADDVDDESFPLFGTSGCDELRRLYCVEQ